jgi:uncharacterized protein involved in exopolysaccharide biosynthesis
MLPLSRPMSPAERCIRTIAANWRTFSAIIAASVAIAAAITARQPTLYASTALLSVRPPADVLAEALRLKRPYLDPDGHVRDEADPERQTGPGRYAPRLTAPGLVTLAARDAGIIDAATALDSSRAAAWVQADRIERSDLVQLTAWQPTPDAAQKLAAAIVARALALNRTEQAGVDPPEIRRALSVVDAPTRPSRPAYPRWSANLAAAVGIGVLVASLVVAIRGIPPAARGVGV